MNRSIAFLMNPNAGTGKKKKLKDFITEQTSKTAIPFAFFPTNAEGQYQELEQTIISGIYTDVVIVGGDGTIRNVVAALRHTGVRFGIIPIGSGNGLAYSAAIPANPQKALSVIFNGYAEPIDAFLVNGIFSCMLSGIGFDAKVAHEFSKSSTRGIQTYLRIGFRNFFSAKPYPFRIHVNNQSRNTDAFFISNANSNQFGNQFTIAPKAKLNDGLLDVVVVQKMTKFQLFLSIIQQIRFGDIRENIFRENCILYFQTDRFSIDNLAGAPFHIDGDPAETADSFSVELIPNAFPLIMPDPTVSSD